MKIGIIGSGNVGSALQRGLAKAGHEARTSDSKNAKEVAAFGEVLFLAVPFGALDAVVRELGESMAGKVVVDATNALSQDSQLALGFSTSGAEELQKKIPKARVVKAFNTVFAQHMDSGKVGGATLTVFAAGDDEAARKTVLGLAQGIGFDAVDGGPLKNARLLEPMGYFNIQLGYVLGMGTDVGFHFHHRK